MMVLCGCGRNVPLFVCVCLCFVNCGCDSRLRDCFILAFGPS